MFYQFCTLYDFTYTNGYPPFKPLIQSRLRSRIESLAKLHPTWKIINYIQYFVEIIDDELQPESEKRFAHEHLITYFDKERCYLIWRLLHNHPLYSGISGEIFDVTNDVICDRDKLKNYINKYKSNGEDYTELKSYIQGVIKNVIRDKLNWQSSWHLLCDVNLSSGRKLKNAAQKLKKALENYGVSEPKISQCIFAWQYFVPIYKSNRVYNPNRKEGDRWPEPETADFAETARNCNANRFLSNAPLQLSSGSEITPDLVREWLNICIKALQEKSRVVEIPLSADNNEKERWEAVNFWNPFEPENGQADFLEIADPVFLEEVNRIEKDTGKLRSGIPLKKRKAVMPLCYPHELSLLNQGQFGTKIGVNQGTVSRYITNYYEVPLLDMLKKLVNERLGSELNLWVQDCVKEFLEKKFTNPNSSDLIDVTLSSAVQNLAEPIQLVLKLYYGQGMTVTEITNLLSQEKSINHNEVMQVLVEAKTALQIELSQQIDSWQKKYIKLWLKKHYKNKIQDLLLETFNSFSEVTREIIAFLIVMRHSNNNEQTSYEYLTELPQSWRWRCRRLNLCKFLLLSFSI